MGKCLTSMNCNDNENTKYFGSDDNGIEIEGAENKSKSAKADSSGEGIFTLKKLSILRLHLVLGICLSHLPPTRICSKQTLTLKTSSKANLKVFHPATRF